MGATRNSSQGILGAFALLLAGSQLPVSAAGQYVIFVKADAAGHQDGTNWQDAFTDLQDALDAAKDCDEPVELWIAAGTYKPDRGTGDRTMSFEMPAAWPCTEVLQAGRPITGSATTSTISAS